eukprot:g6969.t1
MYRSATEKEEDFIITDLETGKKYRITDDGDKIEVVDGDQIPVDEFLLLFQHAYLPPTDESHDINSRPDSASGSTGSLQRKSVSKWTGSHGELTPELTCPVNTSKKTEKCLSDLRLVQEIKIHKGVIWVMQFCPNSKLLATGGQDTNIYIWKVLENRGVEESDNRVDLPVFDSEPMKVFKGHSSDILDISWAPGSEFVLSASMDKSVRLWHVDHEHCLREFPHVNYVTSIRFHPIDSSRFISGSGDGVLRLWNITEYKVVASASVKSEEDIFTALCFSKDGQTIVAGCITGRCRIYELNENRLEKRAEVDVKNRAGKHRKGTKVTGIVQVDPKDNTFLVSTHDSRIRLLQATTPPRHICKFKGHTNDSGRPIVASVFNSGEYVISGSDDGRVHVWDGAKKPYRRLDREKISEMESFQAHQGFCACAVFCPMTCCRPVEKLDIGSRTGSNYPALMKMIGMSSTTESHDSAPREFRLWGQVIVTGGSRGEIRVWENFGLPISQ